MGKWKLGQIVAVETVSNLGAKTRTSRTEFPNLDTRIDVAAMQFDWEAPGRTTNSANSFSKRSTKSTNKAVNPLRPLCPMENSRSLSSAPVEPTKDNKTTNESQQQMSCSRQSPISTDSKQTGKKGVKLKCNYII